tara:strand:- start:18556 stop:18987 length:432 start_codon:yes stop_codon:yes gene_type:complete
MKILVIISLLIFMASCGTRVSGSYEILMQINTLNKYNDPLKSSCKLYSSDTRIEFTSPREIRYQANCGPINIICKTGSLTGEYGLLPEEEEIINTNTILSTGAGVIFNRIVEATTPFGMFVRYTNAFDDSTCLIPKEIDIILE